MVCWRDGTRFVTLEPHELIARICAMVPPPQFHMVRFHGVLAPNSALREQVVASARPYVPRRENTAPNPVQLPLFGELFEHPDADVRDKRRKPWAWLLRHVFAVDVNVCPQCRSTEDGLRRRWSIWAKAFGVATSLLATSAAFAETPANKPAGTTSNVTLPTVVEHVDAVYPQDKLAQGIDTNVEVLVTVERNGTVSDAKIAVSGGEAFDAAALVAVRRYDRNDPMRGPSAWGFIVDNNGSLAYPACADTKNQQSPIALPSPDAPWVVGGMPLNEQTLRWSPDARVDSTINNGKTWLTAIARDPVNSVLYRDEPHALEQFHFHSPSEHTIGGRRFPMEMHFVHRGGAQVVVVAVFVEESVEDNPEFTKLWERFPECPQTRPTPAEDITIDLPALLPTNIAHFEYDGSLTVPPCTRPVHFIVLTSPITASAAQIAAFSAALGQTNRPVQPVLDEMSVLYEMQD